jgi:long-subunit acyl-CoA synthetase (AMP-forming)
VLSKVRGVFGDRLAVAMCGAAPIGREVLEFLDACGVLVLEGYGMTETCAAATLNTPRALRFGSVGRPLDGTRVEIAEDGEVLLAGPQLFEGYHRDPAATADVMTGGRLRSGDLGEIDADGYLHITGRKKDLIITSSGKNISPENLESALRETQWLSWGGLAIVAMWLAVLFVGIFGPDFEAGTPGGTGTTTPGVLAVVPFAFVATIIVARHAFRTAGDEWREPLAEEQQQRETLGAEVEILRAAFSEHIAGSPADLDAARAAR